jgi:hypothetical protein
MEHLFPHRWRAGSVRLAAAAAAFPSLLVAHVSIAALTQSGSYLEAEILQSGAAHVASVSQFGAGTASSPYRASITQLGAQPQSFSVQQQARASPRAIRVIQR